MIHRSKSIYLGPHTPLDHFARVGYELIADGVDLIHAPDDGYEDEHPGSQRHYLDCQVLDRLRSSPQWPKAPRKKQEAAVQPTEETRDKVELAGVRIDWHFYCRDLVPWSGQATMQSTIVPRLEAIRANRLARETWLLDWQLPLETASGLSTMRLDAVDVGFSPSREGVLIATRCAAELLAIIGIQSSTLIRYSRREWGYFAPDGSQWRFSVQMRQDSFASVFQLAMPVGSRVWGAVHA